MVSRNVRHSWRDIFRNKLGTAERLQVESRPFVYALLFSLASAASAEPMMSTIAEKGQQPAYELTPTEEAFLTDKGELRVCVDPDWMPLEKIEAGRHVGIAADFMKIIEDRLGIPIVLHEAVDWQQSIEAAKSRQCDIFSLAMPTPDRLKYMTFTRPYLRLPLVLATRKEESFVGDVTLITNRPMGIVRGYAYGEILRKKYPKIDLRDVDSLKDGLTQVERNELYGLVDNLASIGYLVQRGYPELKIAGKFDHYWELGVGVRNDQPQLFSVLDKIVTGLDPSEVQAILNHWISVKYEQSMDYSAIGKAAFIALLLAALLFYRQALLKRHNLELQRLSEIDPLTQVASRRRLDRVLSEQISLLQRYQYVFSIILLDIDNFKAVNDKYGHLAGDEMLVSLCDRLQRQLRSTDTLGRWGGEEFLIICPETNREQAMDLAELLRRRIADTPFGDMGKHTASFGIAEGTANMSAEALISQADAELYQAKSAGRNRVCCLTSKLPLYAPTTEEFAATSSSD